MTLLVCNGSENFAPEDWVKDLMQGKASGFAVAGERRRLQDRSCLARGLAYPNGVVADRRVAARRVQRELAAPAGRCSIVRR